VSGTWKVLIVDLSPRRDLPSRLDRKTLLYLVSSHTSFPGNHPVDLSTDHQLSVKTRQRPQLTSHSLA
jgi:hypothetical protein